MAIAKRFGTGTSFIRGAASAFALVFILLVGCALALYWFWLLPGIQASGTGTARAANGDEPSTRAPYHVARSEAEAASSGRIRLDRGEWVEVYEIADATIRSVQDPDESWLFFEARPAEPALSAMPERFEGTLYPPELRLNLRLRTLDIETLVGRTFHVSGTGLTEYDVSYYDGIHNGLVDTHIEFLARDGDRFFVRITGRTDHREAFNRNHLEIDGWFTYRP